MTCTNFITFKTTFAYGVDIFFWWCHLKHYFLLLQVAGADSFESILKPLLSNIRFGALTAKEFVYLRHHARLKEVLSKEDSLAILEHLINPLLAKLPDWCCTKTRRYSPPEKEEIQSKTRRKRRPKSPCSLKLLKEARSSSFSYSSSSSLTSSNSSSSSSDTSD